MARVGREMAPMEKAKADAEKSAEMLRDLRKAVLARQERKKLLWTGAFGEESFFGPRLGREFESRFVAPCPPAEVAIPGHGAVSRADALQRFRAKYILGGFKNAGNTCYISAVLQLLLHMPAVMVWLEEHERLCELRSHRCLVCALSESRKQFGVCAVPPVLTMERSKVSRDFSGHQQHDAVEFLACLLDQLRQMEVQSMRFSPWPGVAIADGVQVATQVDRLAGYVEEKRLRCEYCGLLRTTFQREFVLSLPLPEDGSKEHSVTDLYLSGCALDNEDLKIECCSEVCQGARRRFAAQSRVASFPNVLFVQVRRTGNDGLVSRHRITVEDQFSLPGLGVLELAGIVYHSGGISFQSGHYTCASRGPDRLFWYFDDSATPRRLGEDIADFKCQCVVLLAYVRPGGEAVYASAAVDAASPGERDASDEGPVAAAGGRVGAPVPVERRDGSTREILGVWKARKGIDVGCIQPAVGGMCVGVANFMAQDPQPEPDQAPCGNDVPAAPVRVKASADGVGKAVPDKGAELTAWWQFTASQIDPAKCLARTWNDGLGGQCPRRPCVGGQVCKIHAGKAGLLHGLVTGPIPDAKLREFEQNAAQRRGQVETPRTTVTAEKRTRPSPPAEGSPAHPPPEKCGRSGRLPADSTLQATDLQGIGKREPPSPPAGASPAQPSEAKVSKVSRALGARLPDVPLFPVLTVGSVVPAAEGAEGPMRAASSAGQEEPGRGNRDDAAGPRRSGRLKRGSTVASGRGTAGTTIMIADLEMSGRGAGEVAEVAASSAAAVAAGDGPGGERDTRDGAPASSQGVLAAAAAEQRALADETRGVGDIAAARRMATRSRRR